MVQEEIIAKCMCCLVVELFMISSGTQVESVSCFYPWKDRIKRLS